MSDRTTAHRRTESVENPTSQSIPPSGVETGKRERTQRRKKHNQNQRCIPSSSEEQSEIDVQGRLEIQNDSQVQQDSHFNKRRGGKKDRNQKRLETSEENKDMNEGCLHTGDSCLRPNCSENQDKEVKEQKKKRNQPKHKIPRDSVRKGEKGGTILSMKITNSPIVELTVFTPESTQEMNTRLRSVFEEEDMDFGQDVVADELANRFKVAIGLREKRINEVFKAIEESASVQLCFLIDATGSMDPHIAGVKDAIMNIVDELCKRQPDLKGDKIVKKILLSIFAYRDFDVTCRHQRLQFTKSVTMFHNFCANLKAYGGRDAAEDVAGGLDGALKLNWLPEYRTKVIFHIADYPGHGQELHNQNSNYDDYLNGDPYGLKYPDLFKSLREKNIQYFFGKIHNRTDIMIQKFSEYYGSPVIQFNIEEVNRICESVVSAVKESVSTSVDQSTTVGTKTNEISSYILDTIEPNWNKCKVNEGKFICYKHPTSIQDILNDIPLLEEEPMKGFMKIAANPFAMTSGRMYYYAREDGHFLRKSDPHSPNQEVKSHEFVMKEYVNTANGLNTSKRYKVSNRIQIISSYLAIKFNKDIKEKVHLEKRIQFLNTRTFCYSTETAKARFMTCEPRIKKNNGQFLRFTNNTNYSILESKTESMGISKEFLELIVAFSHWTYEVTHGYLMIVDLQGNIPDDVNDKTHILVTDPAIHCKDVTRFGHLNLGTRGMQNFFKRHCCNHICQKLNLSEPTL